MQLWTGYGRRLKELAGNCVTQQLRAVAIAGHGPTGSVLMQRFADSKVDTFFSSKKNLSFRGFRGYIKVLLMVPNWKN